MWVFAHLHLHESCDAKQFWVLFVCCKYLEWNLRQNQLLLQVTVSSFSLTPPWHYLWHFPPQRDRKYNRAVTKAPSAGQCGHFCGITKNDKQSERERGTDTFIKHKRVSADERVPLSQRISEFLEVYFSNAELTVPKLIQQICSEFILHHFTFFVTDIYWHQGPRLGNFHSYYRLKVLGPWLLFGGPSSLSVSSFVPSTLLPCDTHTHTHTLLWGVPV